MYRTLDQKCNITVEVHVYLWSLTVVMDILLFFNSKNYIFIFHCLQLKKIGHVPTCTIRQGGANMLLLFKIRQYICAASHHAPIN
jgi:hypothetical protein